MTEKEKIWEKTQPCLKPGCPARYYHDGYCAGPCNLYNEWLKLKPQNMTGRTAASIASLLIVTYARKIVKELAERKIQVKYLDELDEALHDYYEAKEKSRGEKS